MRRRLLLERAAWRLSRTAVSITKIALDADYGSLEAFTMLKRLQKTDTEFQNILRGVRDRGTWTDTFVDKHCEHVITFNSYRRLLALDALRSLGARIKGSGCPMDYEQVLAEAGVVE